MRTNYHTHTERCNHAKGSDEEYVLSAIKGGYELLGFSDHTPFPFEDKFYSDFRMRMNELDGYLSSVRSLKEKYADKIEIKVGLECEYYTEQVEWLREIKKSKQLDYLLFGNHFVYDEQTSPKFSGTKTRKDLELYISSSIEAMESGLYDCFAHPELFMRSYPATDKHCLTLFRELVKAARELDIPLEFNTTMPYHEPIWEIIADEQAKVIIGMDAHNNKVLENTNIYCDAEAIISKLGINLITRL